MMKKIYLCCLLVLCTGIFSGGCKENPPPPNPEKEAFLRVSVQCPKCRKTDTVGNFERINQALGRCPHCKKVVNVMQAAGMIRKKR